MNILNICEIRWKLSKHFANFRKLQTFSKTIQKKICSLVSFYRRALAFETIPFAPPGLREEGPLHTPVSVMGKDLRDYLEAMAQLS